MAARGDFLGRPVTADYKPTTLSPGWWHWALQRGAFTYYDIEAMRRDPQVQLGLRMIAGPVFTAKWEVKSKDERVKNFVDRTLKRIWQQNLGKAIRPLLEWGSTGGEVTYRQDDDTGLLEFNALHDVLFYDVKPLAYKGQAAGVSIANAGGTKAKLIKPRAYWIADSPEGGRFFGVPRLAGAWEPWMEKRGRHGAIDIRRLWFGNNVYTGATIRHPLGRTKIDGVDKDNQEIAREIVEKRQTGAVMALPSDYNTDTGKYYWDIEEPVINGNGEFLLQYPEKLDKEILVGLGIPPEVIQAAETGSGWSGRSVPFVMFLTSEDLIVSTFIQAFCNFIIGPLVQANFGNVPWEVEPLSLIPKDDPNDGQGGLPSSKPAGPGGDRGGSPLANFLPANMSQDSFDLADNDPWSSYQGPRGGQGWKNTQTGDVIYGDKPGAGETGHANDSPADPKGFFARVIGTAKKAAIGTRKKLGAVLRKLDKATDLPGARKLKDLVGAGLTKIADAQRKTYATMEKRYGRKAALGIFGAAQAIGGNPALLPGWFVAIPGSTLLAQLPMMGIAEAILQAARGVKAAGKAVGLGEGEEELSLQAEDMEDMAGAVVESIYRDFSDWLDENQGDVEALLKLMPEGEINLGEWITIGAKAGEDGKKRGGSPVYIENGRITKGHPRLTGKKIDALDKPEERKENPKGWNKRQIAGARTQEAKREKEQETQYQRALWAKKDRKEGVDPGSLHQLAADILAHDQESNADVQRLLKDVRKNHPEVLSAHLHRDKGADFESVKGFDKIADGYANSEFRDLFPEGTDPRERLFDLLTGGGPDGMSEAAAYEQALEYLKEHGGRHKVSDEPIPLGDALRAGRVVDLGAAHAPEGGVTVQGTFYPGGQWIPGEVMEKASAAEKKQVKGGAAKSGGKKEPAKTEGDDTKPKRAAPGSQMEESARNKLREFGMVGTFPPAEVPMSDVKIADLSRGKEALKFEPLMSWSQKTKSGRISRQYRYTQEFHDRNAGEKFERVVAIEPYIDKIGAALTKQMSDVSLPQRQREAAAIASAIRETGLRPTDGDESVKHGHFGISSLQARHAKIVGDEIHLDFIGKEGVRNQTIISEPANVAFFKDALKNKSGEQFIFEKANSDHAGDALKDASKAVGGPEDIKIKDLRTLKATRTARKIVETYDGPPPPLTGNKGKDVKAIQSAILKMSGDVAKVLNNTPTQARDNYIHPEIFKSWQSRLLAAS